MFNPGGWNCDLKRDPESLSEDETFPVEFCFLCYKKMLMLSRIKQFIIKIKFWKLSETETQVQGESGMLSVLSISNDMHVRYTYAN